ncbi:uncharacterized protein LOC126843077 [Adelges cooleyi]|uniref:uncharacterized protein LOC126843077 n=1 Tax=Adelges cooleyi TaxID=133065 RepID=UPI00217FFD52|nr:uncharacterized protein LOC126843077 [Adelges cooleyi]
MIRRQVFIAIAVFGCLALLPKSGQAVNCWVCSTDTDPRCGNPFNMSRGALEDCSRAPHSAFLQPVCKKQVQRVNGELVIMRSCAWSADSRNDDGPCAINTPAHIRIEHCSTCDQDYCNAATDVGSTVFLSSIMALSVKLIPRLF